MVAKKYKYKQYLSGYDLDVELFEKFNLKVHDIIPLRKVFILCTDKGNKVFKKLEYNIEKVEFIFEALEYVEERFDRVVKFCKGCDGKKYIIWNDEIYCLMDYIDGRECQYSNPIDLAITSKTLGEFHKAGENIESNINNKMHGENIINIFSRKLNEINLFKSLVNIYDEKNYFDKLFLDNVDYYIEQMEYSIENMKKSKYSDLWKEENKVVLCHHDLIYRNIMIKESNAYFIDFDYSIIDIRVHDLCNFIIKVCKDFYYDMDKAYEILEEYSKVNKLDKEELEVLYYMMVFPDDFYSLCKNYYCNKKDWTLDSFINRLSKKVDLLDSRKEFLKEFRRNI